MTEHTYLTTEELAGKITHNEQKVQHGKDLRTGELKKKEMEDDKVSAVLRFLVSAVLN